MNTYRMTWIYLALIARFIVAQFPDDFTTGTPNWSDKTTCGLDNKTTQWDRQFDASFPGNWGPGGPVSQEEYDITMELLVRWVNRTETDEQGHQNWIDSRDCLTKDENMNKWIEVNEKYVELLERMESYGKRQRQVTMCCATMGVLVASTLVWLESDCANTTVQYLTAIEVASYKFPIQQFCEFYYFKNYTHCVKAQSKSVQKDFFAILPASIDDQFVANRTKLKS